MNLLGILGASLVGSLHCAGMCGGFSAVLAGAEHPRRAWAVHHGMRLAAYTGLGALAGGVGASLNRAVLVAGLQNVAAPLAAFTLIFIALRVLWRGELGGEEAPVRLRVPKERERWTKRMQRRLALTGRRSDSIGAAATGLLAVFLPCGWLWSFALLAASTGSPLEGAALMAAFGAGTLPALLGAGWVSRFALEHLGRWAPRLGAAVLLALGVATAFGWLGRGPLREEVAAADVADPDAAPCHSGVPEVGDV